MRDITGLIGRDGIVEKSTQEVRKGRHLILTGGVGIGKSSVLEAILERLERRRDKHAPVDVETDDRKSFKTTSHGKGYSSNRPACLSATSSSNPAATRKPLPTCWTIRPKSGL